jgi:hypothetical protein
MNRLATTFCILALCAIRCAAGDICLSNFLDSVDSGTILDLCDVGGLRTDADKLYLVQGGETGTATIVKSNWGYVTGDGDSSCQDTVTYGTAFAAVPDVVANCAGSTNAVPSSRDDARVAASYVCTAQALTASQFTIVVTDVAGGNISTNTRVVFCWIAKPAGSD